MGSTHCPSTVARASAFRVCPDIGAACLCMPGLTCSGWMIGAGRGVARFLAVLRRLSGNSRDPGRRAPVSRDGLHRPPNPCCIRPDGLPERIGCRTRVSNDARPSSEWLDHRFRLPVRCPVRRRAGDRDPSKPRIRQCGGAGRSREIRKIDRPASDRAANRSANGLDPPGPGGLRRGEPQHPDSRGTGRRAQSERLLGRGPDA